MVNRFLPTGTGRAARGLSHAASCADPLPTLAQKAGVRKERDGESHLGSAIGTKEEQLNDLEGCGTRNRTRRDGTQLTGLAKDLCFQPELIRRKG